jgi:glycosyltransferase involved in cell wall biosynthesis
MKSFTISIITVCFNSVKTIEETIQSVLAQSYSEIEYIIIDGGSCDGTKEVVAKYAHKIAHVISEPDKGIYDAMNKGLKLARGEVIGLLNADDVYANNEVIAKIAKVMNSHSLDACFGDLIYFSSQNPEKIVRYWRSNHFVRGAFAKGWCPPHPTFFVKRDVYTQFGLFDTSYAMGNDVELMMRFLEKHQIQSEYVPEILVKMRVGGVSNRGLKNIWLQNKNIIKAARKLDIPISVVTFFIHKLLNRLSQFIQKPVQGSFYVK